jgi:16S rRNA (guanine(966)-N(2))-methyltransferase RsmD
MDRVKESLFNVLGGKLSDTRALDLFAGCGSLGLEALSRGVREVVFVDSSRSALDILKKNVQKLGLNSCRTTVLSLPWDRAVERLKKQKISFDLILMDPPYGRSGLIQNVLLALGDSGIVRPSSRIVVEHSCHEAIETPRVLTQFELTKQLKFGETSLSFLTKV